MSQSSVSDGVKELGAIGFPVRQSQRMPRREDKSPAQFGSDLWFARWSVNAFRNYPVVSKAVGPRFLVEACKDLPAFVVGVSPSLDDDIKDLKGLKNRAIIVSTDAALRALLAAGIRPDLVVSFDCKDRQRLLWESLKEAPPCLFNSCTHPDSIATYPGPVLFYNQFHTNDELCHLILPIVYPNLGQLPSAGTVGNMAMIAADMMGCSPICAVGMEFCYQPIKSDVVAYRYRATDWKFQPADIASGMPDRWQSVEIKELYDNSERLSRAFDVEVGGKIFKTDPELHYYAQSFDSLMKGFKIPVVNCSPEGMIAQRPADFPDDEPHIGFKTMTVAQAVERFCGKEFQDGRTVLSHLAKIIRDPRKP